MTYFQPLYPVLLLVSLGLLIRHWRRTAGAKPRLLGAALGSLVIVSLPPVAWLASGALEWWYPTTYLPQGEAEAIVVLSGNVYAPGPDSPMGMVGYDTYTRCLHGAGLFKNWRQLPTLACGGKSPSSPQGPACSQAMKAVLEAEGVPSELIWLEDRSQSTYENARFGAEILRARGIHKIALVTDARHMPRAERCFRKQGLEVLPAPCNFHSSHFELNLETFLPGTTALRRNDANLHEYLGLGWYYLCGRI